jgi:hypothetical protein
MAKWRKREGLGKAMAREGKGIVKGVARELLSLFTLGMANPRKAKFRFPKPKRGR